MRRMLLSYRKLTIHAAFAGLAFAAAVPGSCLAAVEFSAIEQGQPSPLQLWSIGWIGNTTSSIQRVGGAQNIDVVRIGSTKEWALDANNNLAPEAMAEIDQQIAKAVEVQQGNPNVRYAMVSSGGGDIDPYYIQSNGIELRGTRWLELFRATRNYVEGTYGIPLAHVEVLNEQDFGNKLGTRDNFNNIQQRFQDDPEFADIPVIGPSTLSSGAAQSWYDPLKNTTDYGATHLINGSGVNYRNFVQQVAADGKPYFGSEVHHLVEMIIAEEYGGIGGSWWNTVSEVRGQFVQATEGNRLFYEERIGSTSAASGYRDVNDPGKIHVFAASGGNNDGGATFEFSADRPVYWDGVGPQQTFTVTIGNTEERYIEVVVPELTSAIAVYDLDNDLLSSDLNARSVASAITLGSPILHSTITNTLRAEGNDPLNDSFAQAQANDFFAEFTITDSFGGGIDLQNLTYTAQFNQMDAGETGTLVLRSSADGFTTDLASTTNTTTGDQDIPVDVDLTSFTDVSNMTFRFYFLGDNNAGNERTRVAGPISLFSVVSLAELPGDFNGDGVVDSGDFAVWRNNLGAAFDLNGNGDESGASAGVVDAADLALWRENFGANSNTPPQLATAPTAIPEPTTVALALLAMLAGPLRCRGLV